MTAENVRTEPCPCGSGETYARCCADRDAAAGRETQAATGGGPRVAAREEWVDAAFDEIRRATGALILPGRPGDALLHDAFMTLEPHEAYLRADCLPLLIDVFGGAARAFGDDVWAEWGRLLRPHLSPNATRLLDLLDATPPRGWVTGENVIAPSQDVRGRPVWPLQALDAPDDPLVPVLHWLTYAETESCGYGFGWCLPLDDTFLFIELWCPPVEAVDRFLAGLHDDWHDPWTRAVDLLIDVFETDPVVNAARHPHGAPEHDPWHAAHARKALLAYAVGFLLAARGEARAVARANPRRLVARAKTAVTEAAAHVTWASDYARVSAADLLAFLGFDAEGRARDLERDALARHPVALLAVDPEAAGLPPVDPRAPIGAAAAVASRAQAKALDKALTAYEREVRFAHVIRAISSVPNVDTVAWRYDLVQAGLLELGPAPITQLPLSELGLTRRALNRLADAIRDGTCEPTIDALPRTFRALKRLRGVGEKTHEALVDAIEDLFSTWRWRRAGIDRASWAAATPDGDTALDTLSSGLDRLDALFR